MKSSLNTVPSMREKVSDEEWALRIDLAAAFRLVAFYGWDDLIFTHLSARVPGTEHHFLINPYGNLFEEMTASSLLKIDLNGDKVLDQPGTVNLAGFIIHSAIHHMREDAKAIIHLHTPHGQAVSAIEDGLLPYTQTAMIVHHDVAYHEHEGIAHELDERERIVADLGDKNVLILRNHGTLAVGSSIAQAFLRMYLLERACEAQVLMLGAGAQQLHRPPNAAVKTVAEQSRSPHARMLADQLAWPALLRRLDRIDPGYRD